MLTVAPGAAIVVEILDADSATSDLGPSEPVVGYDPSATSTQGELTHAAGHHPPSAQAGAANGAPGETPGDRFADPAITAQVDNLQDVGPVLTVAQDQVTDEGALLAITDIGSFVDAGSEFGGEAQYIYTIDWGDGTPVDSGPATIDSGGEPGSGVFGSFDGAHTYADNGVYTVTVTIASEFSSSSETLTVTVSNVRPTLSVVPDQTVDEGSPLVLTDIGRFTDPGFDNPLNEGGETSERFSFAIDWGDGTPIDSGPATIDVAGGSGSLTHGSFDGVHTYADSGIYTVTVTLSDDDGGTVVETFTVRVFNVSPSLVVASDQVANEGALLTIPKIGQFSDPGFDNPLNEGGETSERFSFAIDWGDGTPIDSGPATIDVPGGPGVPTSGSFGGSHIYADNGVYTVTVTISDDDGGTTSETITVTVFNVKPTLVVPPDQVVDQGSLLSLPNIGQFTDPGFDNPLNVGGETTERFTFAIDWGDGSDVDSGPATIDVFGSAGVLTAGSFDGSHTFLASGTYTVTVTVSDDDGGTTSKSFTVTVLNVAPTLVAGPDQTTDEGAPLSVTNIGVFSDSAGRQELPGDYTYTIDWGDGTPLDAGVATIDVPGGPGVPLLGSFDGAHVYADNGVYTVILTITDPDGNAASETLTVTVANVKPTLVVVPDQIAAKGAVLALDNIGQFTDPGFDNPLNEGGETTERFTFAIDWGDGSDVDSGPATIDVFGSPGVLTAGSFDGQHAYANGGAYQVTVTLSDDDGGKAVARFTVYVGPSLVAAGPRTVDEGSLLAIDNIGQFTDHVPPTLLPGGPEGATQYAYTIDWGDGTPLAAGMGTIDLLGTSQSPTIGSFSGQHVYADNGVYLVSLSITSIDGRSDAATLVVTVNNVAPKLTVVGDQTVAQVLPLSLPNLGLFTDPGFDNPLNAGGETTERFTFSIDWGDGTVFSSGPGTIDAPGGPGGPTVGSFDGQHAYAAAGTFTVTVTLSDDDGGTAVETFDVVVAVIRPRSLFFTPGVGAGTTLITRPAQFDGTPQPSAPVPTNQDELSPYRIGSVAGAEARLVLRIVSPAGEEYRDQDEPLANDVLDHLGRLFARMPDGHYRIYLIQPDGIERLVVDVIVRGGRSIDPVDDLDGGGPSSAMPPAGAAGVDPPPAADAPVDQQAPVGSPAGRNSGLSDPAVEPAQPPNVPDNGDQALQPERAIETWTNGGGYLAYAAAGSFKYRRALRAAGSRPALNKLARLLRRPR